MERVVLRALFVLPFAFFLTRDSPVIGQPGMASILIHNAVIHTVDAKQPRAEAIAIRGSRILAVGTNAEILKTRGPYTRVIDAQGGTVIPGLHDAHGHFTGLGALLQRLDLRGTTSYAQVLEKVRARVATAKPGEWILGRNWDQNDWPTKAFPTHEELDKVAPNNPVYLNRVDGHAALVNAVAMKTAGLTRESKDPPGGRIIRNAAGAPTGVLVDRAMGLVSGGIPPESDDRVIEQIKLADRECRRLGLTMVHDAGASPRVADLYKKVAADGGLQTRLYVMLRGSLADLAPLFAKGPVLDEREGRMTVRAIKISADGALGSRGAALLEDYSDERGNRGLILMEPDRMYELTLAAAKAGFQTCIHAIGDRANRIVLDLFERVQEEVPAARDLRLRTEHAQILDAADIPRFAKLGVIASMQGTHCTSDMPWAPARLGPQRVAEGAYVWQKLIKSGATIANGSDFPVEEANPMLGFYASITRQDPAGQPPNGWAPDQRMTREQALASFTINAAFAAHAEKHLGSLEAGKLADLVMLSKDIMTVPPREILGTRVVRTIVGGQVVHE
jgi:predicted amidohydrolase YtcJ